MMPITKKQENCGRRGLITQARPKPSPRPAGTTPAPPINKLATTITTKPVLTGFFHSKTSKIAFISYLYIVSYLYQYDLIRYIYREKNHGAPRD